MCRLSLQRSFCLGRCLRVVLIFLPCPGPRSIHPLVVGYFTQGGGPHPFYVKTLISNGSAEHLDQINYSQGSVSGGGCSLADPNSDINTAYTAENSVNGVPDRFDSPFCGYFHQLTRIEAPLSPSKNPHLARRQGQRFRTGRQAGEPQRIRILVHGHLYSRPLRTRHKRARPFRWRRRRLGIPAGRRRRQFPCSYRGVSPSNECDSSRPATLYRGGRGSADASGH